MFLAGDRGRRGKRRRECVGMRRRGPDGYAGDAGYTGTEKSAAAMESQEWDEWRKAEETEMLGMVENCVYKQVARPKDKLVVGTKMLYKRKIGQDGKVEKYKCRLVAQGFWQVEGVHYTEKYSPTPATASIRMLLAMAAAKDGELRHFDAEQAFVKADIDKEIYIEIPEKLSVPTIGGGGDTTIPSPWMARKQPLLGIGLHYHLHGRQACPEFNSFHQGVGQISPPEGLFSCRPHSKRGQICYIPAPPPQSLNDSVPGVSGDSGTAEQGHLRTRTGGEVLKQYVL